jgi:putative phosphoesterase
VKIGLIADVHGNLAALKQVILELRRDGAGVILNAGDNVGYSSKPDECVELLRRENVRGCMGNYDDAAAFNRPECGCGGVCSIDGMKIREASLRWTQVNISGETRKYLSLLPQKLETAAGGADILVIHGGIDAINDRIEESDAEGLSRIAGQTGAEIIVMGHTHIPFVKKLGGKILVNPGSVGRPFDDDPRASYGLLDTDNGAKIELRRTEYDVEGNIRSLIAAGLPADIGFALRNGKEI